MSPVEQLAAELSKGNLAACEKLLTQLKSTQMTITSDSTADCLLARNVLELGAQYSIRAKNIPAFERYMAQLKTYYFDYRTLAPSTRMYSLLGLNLLCLLSQHKLSEFHTELELLPVDVVMNNVYIKHPIEIEQGLMEGSYAKVWNARSNVPAEEYLYFIDILMETIRNDIAECSEQAYSSLPVNDAATLLFFKTPQEAIAFGAKRGWIVKENKLYFGQDTNAKAEIPSWDIIKQTLGYAKELEQIV